MRDKTPITPILIGLAGVAGMVFLLFFSGDDGGIRQVQNAAIGTRVLGPWLRAGGIEVAESNPRLSPRLDSMGLRILPLYDMDLSADAEPPTTRKAAFEASTLVDLPAWVFDAKVKELPTLVILPKWRKGILAVEVAHADTLIPPGEYAGLFRQIGLSAAKLVRGGAEISAGTWPEGSITLFQAQVFDPQSLPKDCRPEISLPEGALLVFCRHDGETASAGYFENPKEGTFFLSDPDLMNNHGLRLAGNAATARALVRKLMATMDGQVYLDVSTELLLIDDEEKQTNYYQRDLGDLERLFAPPFSALWAVLLITMTVLFWRGSVTIIPRKARARLEPDGAGQDHPGLASAAAKARLLRLGGHDGHMIKAFVRSEILRVYRQSLGRNPGREAGENPMLARLHAIWARRDKTRADRLLDDAQTLVSAADAMAPAERARLLNSFRENLEILTDENPDPGRISGSRHPAAR